MSSTSKRTISLHGLFPFLLVELQLLFHDTLKPPQPHEQIVGVHFAFDVLERLAKDPIFAPATSSPATLGQALALRKFGLDRRTAGQLHLIRRISLLVSQILGVAAHLI